MTTKARGALRSGHRITIRESTAQVKVLVGGEVVAESRRALALDETGLPTRYYLPPQDVRTELFERSATTTRCPFKGTAAHWTIRAAQREAVDAAWSYPDPLEERSAIRGHFAFYPERVDEIRVEGG